MVQYISVALIIIKLTKMTQQIFVSIFGLLHLGIKKLINLKQWNNSNLYIDKPMLNRLIWKK